MSTAASKKEWIKNKMYQKYGLDDTPQNFDSDFTISDKILADWGKNVVDAMVLNLTQLNKKVGNNLIQSIAFKVEDFDTYIQLQLYAAPHYKYVNDGRRGVKMNWTDKLELMLGKRKSTATRPPFDAISNWLRNKVVGKNEQKIIWLDKDKKEINVRQNKKVSDKVKKVRLVEAIRYKIKRDGIEPTYFFTQVVNQKTIDDLSKILLDQTGKQLVVNFKKVLET